jgi:hypothetical protein
VNSFFIKNNSGAEETCFLRTDRLPCMIQHNDKQRRYTHCLANSSITIRGKHNYMSYTVVTYQITSLPHHSGTPVGQGSTTQARSQLRLHPSADSTQNKPQTWLPPAHPYPYKRSNTIPLLLQRAVYIYYIRYICTEAIPHLLRFHSHVPRTPQAEAMGKEHMSFPNSLQGWHIHQR